MDSIIWKICLNKEGFFSYFILLYNLKCGLLHSLPMTARYMSNVTVLRGTSAVKSTVKKRNDCSLKPELEAVYRCSLVGALC